MKNPLAHTFFFIALLQTIGCSTTSMKSSNAEPDTRQEQIPLFVPEPYYPAAAKEAGITGYAVVEFSVLKSGNARDVIVLEVEPENVGFKDSAIKAAKGIRYYPVSKQFKALSNPRVVFKFKYEIDTSID